MTKESGVTVLKTFNFVLKMEWAKYYSQPIFALSIKITDFLQQEVIFSYKNTYLFINNGTNFTLDSKIEDQLYSGFKVRPIFTLIRNQIKNRILIRFKFYGNDE